MLSKEFRGEIWTNIDNRIMQAVLQANSSPVDGCVGYDSYTKKATELLESCFKGKIYTTFTINGTGANMIALKAMLDRYSSIICADETHVNVYEAGAFEFNLGNKILVAKSTLGKLSPETIEKLLNDTKKYKYLPKVVVLTQPTELGTLYSLAEIKNICDYAHSKGMYVYIDGARIGTAVCALNTTLSEMLEDTGVDAFSFGGTKAGAMFGEMVVFRNPEFARHLPYIVKQSFQHFDRSKFVGVQMQTLLTDDLWLENSRKANQNAKILEKIFLSKGIEIYYPVETNMVFAKIDEPLLEKLSLVYDLHYWNEEKKIVRFAATAFSDTAEMEKLSSIL